MFAGYRIDEQLAKALERKVWLPSGGSLVIDRTEAMTVIDVNTGKFTGQGGNLEETVTRNNLEAAEEIVRQLRLRDIGGIIVIDFIDMVLESNRDLVLRRLLECLARDRTKHQVAEVTSLGLVQMTRKRVGSGLLEAFSVTCECCNGRGVHVSLEPAELTSAGHRRRGDEKPPADDQAANGGNGDGDRSSGASRRRRRKPAAAETAPAQARDAEPAAAETAAAQATDGRARGSRDCGRAGHGRRARGSGGRRRPARGPGARGPSQRDAGAGGERAAGRRRPRRSLREGVPGVSRRRCLLARLRPVGAANRAASARRRRSSWRSYGRRPGDGRHGAGLPGAGGRLGADPRRRRFTGPALLSAVW